MAIYSAVPPPPELAGATANTNEQHQQQEHESHQPSNVNATADPAANVPSGGVDIESWTVSALESLSISPVVARNTGAPLSIPLDEHPSSSSSSVKKPSVVVSVQDPRSKATTTTTTPPARPPSRRDSQRRREALLRGKVGSRQRRRWENDRLLHVPNAQPPEPADWEPLPLHPVTHVPYQVAAYWDLRVRAEVEARRAAAARRQQAQAQARTLGDGRVPRELFQRAKKTPAVRTWVRSLEEPVRKYLVEREVAREPSLLLTDSEDDDDDVEDEEIVFVGRNGTTMRDGWKRARRETKGRAAGTDEEGMVFDAALGGDDADSAFRRWITHSISEYYGLHSHSVFMGNPKRKVVYVQMKTGHAPPVRADLPRPLWELC